MQKVQRQERQLNALLAKAERGIQLEKNYVQLFWIAIFAAIYLTMLIVQGEIFLHYSLESSVHTTIINQLTAGNGLMYGNALFADKGSLPSSAQFYSWLSSSILQRVLTQPACGVSGTERHLLLGVLDCFSSYRTEFAIRLQNIQGLVDLAVFPIAALTRKRRL